MAKVSCIIPRVWTTTFAPCLPSKSHDRDVLEPPSGGSIRVGIDTQAKLNATSGGGVNVEGLLLSTNSSNRSGTRVSGALSGGGSVIVHAAAN